MNKYISIFLQFSQMKWNAIVNLNKVAIDKKKANELNIELDSLILSIFINSLAFLTYIKMTVGLLTSIIADALV